MLAELENLLASPDIGRALLARAGMSHADAREILASGFYAIDHDILPQMAEILLMNAEPLDMFHASFDISRYSRITQPSDCNIVVVDRFTGAIIRPARLTASAIFGYPGDTRVDLAYLNLEAAAAGRARFHQFPYFVVQDVETLARACEKLRRHESTASLKILFRGQVKDYLVPRSPEVQKFLYGDAIIREPSLLSNAFRNRFEYLTSEPYVRLVLRDILYRRTARQNRKHWVEDRYEQVNLLALGRELDEAVIDVMGISQHYGIPTYGIDATSSWETAFWFATHKFSNQESKCLFRPHEWTVSNRADWPIIYVLRTANAHDLQLMAYPSVRAKAQNGFFLPGSWGLHGNVAAADIICAIWLHPLTGVETHELAEIFPMPTSDPMYRELLMAKQRQQASGLVAPTGLDHIFDLDYL